MRDFKKGNIKKSCGDERNRTVDLLTASQTL